jgi:hypothetical protein
MSARQSEAKLQWNRHQEEEECSYTATLPGEEVVDTEI